jgi:methylenetetrahydrofolate--tRNA-(uracil-5-)-methyltransferase
LRDAEFLRFGSIHRNTYIDSPALLGPALELKARPSVHVAGLITGVEGYIESCAMGLLAALFVEARLRGRELPLPPPTTAFGGLYHHITAPRGPGQRFSPTNINFGLMPGLDRRAKKRDRKRLIAERARADLGPWLARLTAMASRPAGHGCG